MLTKKGHIADEKVTESSLKHGMQFYGYWIYIIYKLAQQPVASGMLSKNNSNRNRPFGWKQKEQKLSIKEKIILKKVKVCVYVCVANNIQSLLVISL